MTLWFMWVQLSWYKESKYLGPQTVSPVERSIIHCPYLRGSTIGGLFTVCRCTQGTCKKYIGHADHITTGAARPLLWYCCARSMAIRVLMCDACVVVTLNIWRGGGGEVAIDTPKPLYTHMHTLKTLKTFHSESTYLQYWITLAIIL